MNKYGPDRTYQEIVEDLNRSFDCGDLTQNTVEIIMQLVGTCNSLGDRLAALEDHNPPICTKYHEPVVCRCGEVCKWTRSKDDPGCIYAPHEDTRDGESYYCCHEEWLKENPYCAVCGRKIEVVG